VVTTARPPEREWLRGARRVRLVLGPGIGLGDETLLRGLPAGLRALAPDADVEIRSARPELWHDAGMTGAARYADALELLDLLRGDDCDAVVLADFEKPALAAALTRQPRPPTYIELALGARAVCAFDARARRLHERPLPGGEPEDYYRFTRQALRFLGAAPEVNSGAAFERGAPAPRAPGLGVIAPEAGAASERVLLVASPFTSKYEPDASAWSALLAALVTPATAPRVRLWIEPGPNLASARWAAELARSVLARAAPGLECALAPLGNARTLDLPGVLRLLRQADVVVCADTFAAHAAPQAGCATLVVAGDELRAWRVPHAPAFYFPDRAAPRDLGGAMRRVLAALDPRLGDPGAHAHTHAARGARRATRALLETLQAAGADLVAAYERCGAELRALAAEVERDWPGDTALLLADRDYADLLPPLPGARACPGPRDELAEHIERLLDPWDNSNLAKFLALAARERA
jgi:ADP-heptose:LPS heptosyltransferase